MTGYNLKILMMFLMVLDHIPMFVNRRTGLIFHFISRPVAPVFAFLTIEAFVHTRSKESYMKRLYKSALIMEGGNYLVNRILINNTEYYVENNIFSTLALGVSAVYIYKKHIEEKGESRALIYLLIIYVMAFFTEGGLLILPFILIGYIYREDPFKRDIIYLGLTLYLLKNLLLEAENLGELLGAIFKESDFLFFIAGLPFIHLYNGKKGYVDKKHKSFFYIFYPLHLWLIAVLASLTL